MWQQSSYTLAITESEALPEAAWAFSVPWYSEELPHGDGQDVVTVDVAQQVVIADLRIRNGRRGLLVRSRVSVSLHNTTVQNNTDNGIRMEASAKLEATGNLTSNNSMNGLEIDRNSEMQIKETFVGRDNLLFGIIMNNSSSHVLRTLKYNGRERSLKNYRSRTQCWVDKEHQEEADMWHAWKTSRMGWAHVLRVVLLAMILFVSACTTLGPSSSNPSTPTRERAGETSSGNGGGGY